LTLNSQLKGHVLLSNSLLIQPSGFPVLLGYCRVSTTKQSLERQLEAMASLGIPLERTFCDKKSGAGVD